MASLNSVSVLLKIGTGLASSKILAILVGPAGIALVGNMRNFGTALETFSTLGFPNGIVRGLAVGEDQKRLFSTVFISLGLVVALASAGLFAFSDFWAERVLGDAAAYGFLFEMAAGLLPLYTLSFVSAALLNGLKKYRLVVWSTMSGNLISLACTAVLVSRFHIPGALAAVILAPSLLCAVTLYFLLKEVAVFRMVSPAAFDRKVLWGLLAFSLMAFFSAIAGPSVYIYLRNAVIEQAGLAEAGHWATMEILSNYGLLFVGTLLTVYFFPRLASARDDRETATVLKEYFRNVIPVFGVGLIVLFLLRDVALRLLFSRDFLPVSALFSWQLPGDFLRACSLIFGYLLLARKKTAMFILTECLSLSILLAGGKILLPHYGVKGVVLAYTVSYGVYLVVLLVYCRDVWRRKRIEN